MGTRNVIRDKATQDGYIKPIEGLHEGLTFKFRLMLPDTAEEVAAQIERASPKESIHVLASAIAPQLTEWSEVDDNGNQVPTTAAFVVRLRYKLLLRLYGIVAGREPVDLAPEPSTQAVEAYRVQVGAAFDGVVPGKKVMEAQLKN